MTIEREISSNAPALVVRTQGSDRSLEAGPSYTIGRNPESDIVVDEARVSWRHAVLRLEGATWLLEDAGSTNGTFLGAQRVQRVEITQDCVLRLGHPEDGQRLWCSPAAPPRQATAIASRLAGLDDPTAVVAPPTSAVPPASRAGRAGRAAVGRPAGVPAMGKPAGLPAVRLTGLPAVRLTGLPAVRLAGLSAGRPVGRGTPGRAAGLAAARLTGPGGFGAAHLPGAALHRGLEHRPPAQRDHAAAHPGAAHRARDRQRSRRLRPQRVPLPRRAAPVEPRRLRDHRPGQPQRHVRQRPAGDHRPGDRGGHRRHRAGHVPSRRAGTAGVHRLRRRLAERAEPDRQDSPAERCCSTT